MTTPAPGPWSRIDTVHSVVLLFSAAIYARFLAQVASTLPPQGDAASHAIAAVEMHDRLSFGWSQAAQSLIYVKASYPPLLYVMSALFFGSEPAANELPLALQAVLVGSLGLGWVLARLQWGLAPAWVLVLIQALSPYFIGHSSHYMLDLPLACAVGVGFVALMYARRFDHVGSGLMFGVVASLGMLIKWAWLYFLGAPLLICMAMAAWRSGATIRARFPASITIVAIIASVIAACLWSRANPPWPTGPEARLNWQYVGFFWACQIPAIGLLLLAWRAAALRPIRGLLATCAAGMSLAGPWYLMAQNELWSRFTHESGVLAARVAPPSGFFAPSAQAAQSFFPFIDVAVVAALALGVLARPSVRADLGFAALGIGLGFYGIVETLPFDPRYLLPLLPLAAGAVAAGSSALPSALRWGVVGLVLASGLSLVSPRGTPESGELGAPAVRDRARNPDVTWQVPFAGRVIEALRVQPALDFSGFDNAIKTIDAECKGNCNVILKSHWDFWVQSRTIEAAGRLRGIRGIDWTEGYRPGDPRGPSRTGSEAGRTFLVVFQPCARRVHERGNMVQWRREMEKATGARTESIGSFPLPMQCEMYVDRLVF